MLTLLATSAAAASTLCGCVSWREPAFVADLPAANAPGQPPLIVIPGLLASRLVDAESGRRVWPPNLLMLIGGWRPPDLELPVSADGAGGRLLEATDVVLSRLRNDYYLSLTKTFAAAGYDCKPQAAIDAATNCVLLAWDWRRGFVDGARTLAEAVEALRQARGDETLVVDLVAHSAGAMVARYFARFGGVDILGNDLGASAPTAGERVRRMVLIGPPNHGSVAAAAQFTEGYRLSLIQVKPETLATFETSYQLLPHPAREWLVDLQGQPHGLDVYDPQSWRRLDAVVFDPVARARVTERFDSQAAAERYLGELELRFARGLERGRLFHEALSESVWERPAADVFVLGSDCQRTPEHLLVERVDRGLLLHLDTAAVGDRVPEHVEALLYAAGDGRVTRASLLALDGLGAASARVGEDNRHAFVCTSHSNMASNREIQREILSFLLN